MKLKAKIAFLILISLWTGGCFSSDLEDWKAGRLASLSRASYAAAVSIYTKLLSAQPQAPAVSSRHLRLAKLFFERGEYAQAAAHLRGLGSKEARMLLAKSFFKDSRHSDALEVFNSLGQEPDAEYLYFYGLTLEKSNLYDQALRVYSAIKDSGVFEARAKERSAAINLDHGGESLAGLDEEVRKLIQNSPSADQYPQAGGAYLLAEERVYLTEDNRLVSDMHYLIKIFNDRGKESFAEVVLPYDSTYEKLELETARTIRPDGIVVTAGDKNIRDVSLYMNYPLYSNARARIISMPEVASGCVIEYKARVYQSQLPNKKDFNTVYWLQMEEPVLLERMTIDIPEGKSLKTKIINTAYNTAFDMDPKVRLDGARRKFYLEFRNVPQIIPEPSMPCGAKINPYVLFSTFDGWQDVYLWWRSLYQDKLALDEDIRAKTAELILGKKTDEEKIRAIYNFCVQDIRYVAVEYGDAGYEPHYASEIFKNKYGDCKDKAILLITMLAAAGIEAYPVLVSTAGSLDINEDTPTLLFNHAVAAVKIAGKLVFMDATANTTSLGDLPLGDQDRPALVFFGDRGQLTRTPLFDGAHNKMATRMRIKVGGDEKIEAERIIKTQGAYEQAQRYWLKYSMPVLIQETLQNRARAVADNAVLKSSTIANEGDLNQPVVLQYSFNAPKYFLQAGPFRMMGQLGSLDTSIVSKESRSYPIEYPGLSSREEIIEVELPGGFEVKYLPQALEADTPWFNFISRYEFNKAKNTIRFYLADTVKKKTIAVEEYADYKKTVEDIAGRLREQVVLEVK